MELLPKLIKKDKFNGYDCHIFFHLHILLSFDMQKKSKT